MQPTPVLSLGSDLWSPSLGTQPPPTPVGKPIISGCGVLVGTDPLWGILSAFPLHSCCCPLLWGSEAPSHPCQWGDFLACRNFSSFTAPSQKQKSHPYSFVSFFFIFLLPYPVMWRISCFFGSLRSPASVQWVLCRSYSTCKGIFDVFVGRKVISTSYSSTILKLTPKSFYWINLYQENKVFW